MASAEHPTRHVAIIVNTVAGRGRTRIDDALHYLVGKGVTTEATIPSSPQGTRQAVEDAAQHNEPAVVVAGGDGTISAALPALIEQQLPLVIVPVGTGNDLANALGVSLKQPGLGIAAALEGSTRHIDTACVISEGKTTPFATVVAFGFDARVAARTDKLTWPRGKARYYLALAIELARLGPVNFEVRIDDGAWESAPGTLIAVANTPTYGGGMPIAPVATPDDGYLDYVHIAPLGRLELIRLFPKLLRGVHLDLSQAQHKRIRSLDVRAPGLVAYADGESAGNEECRVEVRPGTLRVKTL